MIFEIRLSNFFSIKDEIVLDLRAGKSQSQKARDLENNVFSWKFLRLSLYMEQMLQVKVIS
jgi:hypothetical protein